MAVRAGQDRTGQLPGGQHVIPSTYNTCSLFNTCGPQPGEPGEAALLTHRRSWWCWWSQETEAHTWKQKKYIVKGHINSMLLMCEKKKKQNIKSYIHLLHLFSFFSSPAAFLSLLSPPPAPTLPLSSLHLFPSLPPAGSAWSVLNSEQDRQPN